MTLCVNSPHEVALTKAAERRIWEAFIDGGTTHSGRASTLPYIMRRCEREGVPYRLTAMPGMGYFIEPHKEEENGKETN